MKVPGGGEEAKAFMDDLLLWKAKGQLLAEEETKKNEKRFEKEFGLLLNTSKILEERVVHTCNNPSIAPPPPSRKSAHTRERAFFSP